MSKVYSQNIYSQIVKLNYETVYIQAPHEYFSPASGRVLGHFRQWDIIAHRWDRQKISKPLSLIDRPAKRFPSHYHSSMDKASPRPLPEGKGGA